MTEIEKKNPTLGILATVASATFFGFLAMIVKFICAGGTNTLCCVTLRYVVALPFLFAYLKIKKIPLGITKRQFWDLILLSVFGIGGTAVLLYTSYNYIPTGMCTTLHFMYPMFTMLGCILFCHEKAGWRNLIALGLCIVGIICFFKGELGSNLTGIAFAVASSITYAFYTIYLGHSSVKEMDDFKIMFYVGIISGVMAYIMTVATGKADYTVTPKTWILIIVYVLLVSFVGSLGYQVGVRHIGGQKASILSTFEPVTSVIVGALVLNETLTTRSILGCVAILSAVIVVARGKEQGE